MLNRYLFLLAISILVIPTTGKSQEAGNRQYSIFPSVQWTPGVVRTEDVKEVCPHAHTRSVRHVTEKEKKKVCQEYGIDLKECTGKNYEIDHLVSLELGGSNDIRNLWPEAYQPLPGAREKDRVEDYLHTEVCQGKITLPEAQKDLETDWFKIYQEIGGK